MKKLTTALLIFVSLALPACKDQEAREYAAKLIPVLDSYQEELSQKIKAEQDSYQELAENYEDARKNSITADLAAERRVRSEELGEDVASSRNAPSITTILDEILKYGNRDFETTKALLQERLGARSRYLTELETLEVELQKIKLLKESLGQLSKSKKDFQQLKDAAIFLDQTHSEMNKLLCADLKKELDESKAEVAALDRELAELNKNPNENKDKIRARNEEKKQLGEKIKRLNERITTKKCA